MLDLTYNSGCFACFLNALAEAKGSIANGLAWLAGEWRRRDLFRFPRNRNEVFLNLVTIVEQSGDASSKQRLVESLAYDYARCERVVTNRIPAFFDTDLSAEERLWVKNTVQGRTDEIRGKGVKLQYFATVFSALPDLQQRTPHLFLYLTQTGKTMQVEEYLYRQDRDSRLNATQARSADGERP